MRLLSVHRRPVFRVARVERVPSKLAVTTGNPILNEALKREGQGNRVTRGCCAKGLKSRETMEGKNTSDERRLPVPTGVTWLYCNSRVSCTLALPNPPSLLSSAPFHPVPLKRLPVKLFSTSRFAFSNLLLPFLFPFTLPHRTQRIDISLSLRSTLLSSVPRKQRSRRIRVILPS